MTKVVENKIKESVPKRFAKIFDGRPGGDTHYDIFATFPALNPSGDENVLLGLASMGDKSSRTADDIYRFNSRSSAPQAQQRESLELDL